jgi:hypothetical protein
MLRALLRHVRKKMVKKMIYSAAVEGIVVVVVE